MWGQILNELFAALTTAVNAVTTAVGLVSASLGNILHGDEGTQVSKSNTCANSTVIIHTVTALKTLLLETVTMNVSPQLGNGVCSLFVRNGSDVTVYNLASANTTPNNITSSSQGFSFPTPLRIPAAYDVCLISGGVNATIDGFIKGREI